MARLERGEAEEGRKLLEEAHAQAPDSVEVLHGLARALDLTGERDRARELLERAHARAPADPDPACDLAMLYLEEGEDARAADILKPVLKAQPEHPRANLHMAMALAKSAPARARGFAVRARQGDPETRQQAEALARALTAAAPKKSAAKPGPR
jgi:Tfp pilus assembly protein PilF